MKGDWLFNASCHKSCHQLVIEQTIIYPEGSNFLLLWNSWIFKTWKWRTMNPGNWSLSSLANYAGWSHEKIKHWWNLTALKCVLIFDVFPFWGQITGMKRRNCKVQIGKNKSRSPLWNMILLFFSMYLHLFEIAVHLWLGFIKGTAEL